MTSDVATLQAAMDATQARIRTSFLARVVAYADATGRATVQVLRRPKDRRGLPILQPPIPSVPVMWLSAGALLGIRGTLLPGDDVLCVVLDRDHSPYFTAPAPFDAVSERMHSLSDIVAIPVTFRLTPVATPATIRIGGPAAVLGVVAGANPASAAALQAVIDGIAVYVVAAVPPGVVVPADPTGAAAATALNILINTLWLFLNTLTVSTTVNVE